jgi:hypothetical protein
MISPNVVIEHSLTPGTVYENSLIFGGCGAILNEMTLNESTDSSGGKVIKFKGKLQEAEAINKNKRMYPYSVLDANVKRLQESIQIGGLLGELDHPVDSIVHFANASHKLTKLWWEGNILMGEGQILSTPAGRILRSLISDGVRIGMSSRGVGNGKVNENGVLVIGESYKLITFDAVADPSTYSAFQEKITSKKEEFIDSEQIINNSSVKNESKRIDNTNKQLVLACLSGIVKQQVNEIKERLSHE